MSIDSYDPHLELLDKGSSSILAPWNVPKIRLHLVLEQIQLIARRWFHSLRNTLTRADVHRRGKLREDQTAHRSKDNEGFSFVRRHSCVESTQP